MEVDFTPFFEKYEALVEKVERVFEQMKNKFPAEVQCKPGCSDCCNALFDLTLIESLYINFHFNQQFKKGSQRDLLIEKANRADRQTYKIKRAAYKLTQEDSDDERAIKEVSLKRIRCPLLNDQDLCNLYDFRPIACRIYGIPQAIGGKGHVCGFSGFKPGESYPTFNHDIVHDQLMAISGEFVQAIGAKNFKIAGMLIPVSMALITDFNEEYLGIASDSEAADEENKLNGEKND